MSDSHKLSATDCHTAPDDSAAQPALELARKRAKRLLRLALAGDPAVLGLLRRLLPRLAVLADAQASSTLKLADVQQALAREAGLASWGLLKRELLAQDPLELQAARLVRAVADDEHELAAALLERHPALAEHDLPCACIAANADAVAAMLAAEPALATQPHPASPREPLLLACQSRRFLHSPDEAAASRRCVELLLDAGAAPNAFVLWDSSDPASRLSALYFACNGGNEPVARLLLERGADPNDGESLYHAAEHNHRGCLRALHEHGAELSARHQRWDNTVLFFLCGYHEGHANAASCVEGMRWLLEHGADPNESSYAQDAVPLHRVAEFGHGPEVAELLLAHSAALDARRSDGKTPYVIAIRNGNRRMADWLAAQGADTSGLTPADRLLGHALSGEAEQLQALLAAYPGLVESLSAEDRQVFSNAAWLGRYNALRLLAQAGLDPAWEGNTGGTALHAAAWHGNVEGVRILLELGAPVNIRDNTYGSSPLAWAAHGSVNCRKGADGDYCAVIELLLEAGADRETAVNRWGEAPELLGSKAVVRLLRERGFAPPA